MPRVKPGEIWLVRFPFTDLSSSKLRPALIIAIHVDDAVILGIFSRTPIAPTATHVQIEDQHPAFAQTGLKKTSFLRAEKIAVIHQSVFQKKLGLLPNDLMMQVQEALKKALNVV